MQIYVLEKGFIYKLFMLTAFSLFALVMYQGYITGETIYTILFIVSVALCSFQIASFIYVLIVKRTIHFKITEKEVCWEIFDNKKLQKKICVNRDEIDEVRTEVNYLTGNIYSKFTLTFVLKDNSEIELTDGMIYDLGLKKAEHMCRYLLNNNLGHEQDIKFAKLLNEENIDTFKEQKFSRNDGDFYYIGVISKNKKEFLSLRIQLESLYSEYKIIEKNANNEYLIRNENNKNSYIYLRSNAFGYFIEFYKVKRKEELKMLKEMGRQKIGF